MQRVWTLISRAGARTVIAVPYIWLMIFFALPFFILLRISVTDMAGGVDPFLPLLEIQEGVWTFKAKLDNYVSIFLNLEHPSHATIYIEAYATSLRYAALTTLFCLVLGYPFAYFIARSNPRIRPALLMMVMLPFWTSFLLRVYAWKGLLADAGIINRFFMFMGFTNEPIQMLYTDVSMLVGMTYVYLPFMVLPLYANLVKMDVRLLEAAHDLGASPWRAFWLVTVPLSKSGIIAGSMLVFIPAVGEFVIPSLLGGAENLMIGRVVWDEMFTSNNWPRAAALAVTLILLVLVPLAIYYYRHGRQLQAQGGRG